MNRRQVVQTTLATVGGATLAGCSNVLGGGGGSGPRYDEDQQEEMVLTLDAFPSGWQRDDEINDNFDAVFLAEDESVVVLIAAEVYETVSDAEDQMEEARAGVGDPNEYTVGDDSFWATRNDEIACTIFRDSNAIGNSCAMRESGADVVPDQGRSQDYAGAMFDRWQDL